MKKQSILMVSICIPLIFSTIYLAFTVAAQEQTSSSTEPGNADLYKEPTAETPSYIYGVSPGFPPDDNITPGVSDAPSAANELIYRYYYIPGSALRGRSSTATYVYDGKGCVHVLNTEEDQLRLLHADFHLPEGSIIKFLRLIFIDHSSTGRVRATISAYDTGLIATDIATINFDGSNTFDDGYGYLVSSEITHIVDNSARAYTLIGWPTIATTNLQICGLRIAYYAPSIYDTFLPVIEH